MRTPEYDLQVCKEKNREQNLWKNTLSTVIEGKYSMCSDVISCGVPVLYKRLQYREYTHAAIFLSCSSNLRENEVDSVKLNLSTLKNANTAKSISWNLALVRGKTLRQLPATQQILTAGITNVRTGLHPRYLCSISRWTLPTSCMLPVDNVDASCFQGSKTSIACSIRVHEEQIAPDRSFTTAFRRALLAHHSSKIG